MSAFSGRYVCNLNTNARAAASNTPVFAYVLDLLQGKNITLHLKVHQTL